MPPQVTGSGSVDSSATAWYEGTLASIEAYAQAQADAEANARAEAERQQQVYVTDGVAWPSPEQRALDAFYSNDPNRPPDTVAPGNLLPAGSTYIRPEDVQLHLDNGFTVLQNGQGEHYLPPSPNSDVLTQAPNPGHVPGPDHSGPSTAPDSAPPPPTTPPTAPGSDTGTVDAVSGAGAAVEPDEIRSGFGEKVDGLLNASTTLRQKWAEAQADGWKIRLAGGNGRSFADPEEKTLWINPGNVNDKKNFDANLAALIAHEIGHAVTPFLPDVQSNSRAEYVAKNTEQALEHEGAAAFESARARDQIKTATGTDIGIRGGYDQAYIEIYEEYKSGAISEAEAKSRMTDVQAIEPESFEGSTIVTRQQSFAAYYEEKWKKSHPAQ